MKTEGTRKLYSLTVSYINHNTKQIAGQREPQSK